MKHTTIYALLLASLLAVPAAAQTAIGGAQVSDFLAQGANTPGIALVPAEGGKGNCLQFARGVKGTFTFHKIKIAPLTKYLFSFRGKVLGDDVIEKNARVNVMQVASSGLLPGWRMQFLDADGKPMPRSRDYKHQVLVSENWRTYTDVFYAPTGAGFVQIAIVLPNADNGVLIDEVKFGPCPDEGAINCNPDFRYGPWNYTGWAHVQTGGLLLDVAENKFGLDTAYGSSTETFPVQEPGTYRLSARGTSYGGFRTVDLRFYDEKGGLIKTRSIVALPNGNQVDFLLPEGTVSASFLVYNHVLQEVRLVRMGDASKLAELDAAREAAQKKK